MNEQQMTLSRDWDYRDLTGWGWSEKFDGCRAYWDGAQLWTRGGNVIPAPADFLRAFPAGVPLDGELWAGYDALTVAANAVLHGIWDAQLVLKCFDAPGAAGNWLERMAGADGFANAVVQPVARGIVEARDEASTIAAGIIARGGEGAMFRDLRIFKYETKRTIHLTRIKARNLAEPWRETYRSRQAAHEQRAAGIARAKENAGGIGTARGEREHQPVVGLDVRLFPFDPEIDWKIQQILGSPETDFAAIGL